MSIMFCRQGAVLREVEANARPSFWGNVFRFVYTALWQSYANK